MDKIIIADLTVLFRVGVPEAERARPQRLMFTIEIEHDFTAAAKGDDLAQTVDYDAVCRRIADYGKDRTWKLIETLAVEVADMLIKEFKPRSVVVEIRKFILPQTRYVAVRVERKAP